MDSNTIFNDLLRQSSDSSGRRFRVELVLQKIPENVSIEERENPFIYLNENSIFSQTLLAQLITEDKITVNRFALKMQKNDYPVRKINNFPTNKQVDELWESELNNLSCFEDSSYEIAKLLNINKIPEKDNSELNRFIKYKPISFCKKTQQYFHPFCPHCAEYLVDCQDESLLLKNGLPSYQNTSTRYLYCAKCSYTNSTNNIFYTYSLTPEERAGVQTDVRRRTILYRDYKTLIQKKGVSSTNTEVIKHLSTIFPCFNCQFQGNCFNPIEPGREKILAEKYLIPVSFYESYILPLELLHLQYDAFCDILGGAKPEDSEPTSWTQDVISMKNFFINQIWPQNESSTQFIFKDEPNGLFAVEILRLKLIAFTQLCCGVFQFHDRCHQPHLAINPTSVLVKLASTGPGLPAFWNFYTKLQELGATRPFNTNEQPIDTDKKIFFPPYAFQQLYTSPIILNPEFGSRRIMNVVLRKVSMRKGEKDHLQADVELDILSKEFDFTDFCSRDLFLISLDAPVKGIPNVKIWVSKTADNERGISTAGITDNINQETFDALAKGVGNIFNDIIVTFYKTYFTPCDVYSLGIILCRTLLVNDQEELLDVIRDKINPIIFELKAHKTNINGDVEQTLQKILLNKSQRLSSNSIFYRKDDRNRLKNAISEALWNDILIFIFRLITSIPHFSYCSNQGDYDSEDPGATLRKINSDLDELNKKVHTTLIGSFSENREILEICDDILMEKEGTGK